MKRKLKPPREVVVDLALLIEEQIDGEVWRTGDGVMDLFRLKRKLREQEVKLDAVLNDIKLQGLDVPLTSLQRRGLREEAIGLAIVCMQILDVCDVLDSDREV